MDRMFSSRALTLAVAVLCAAASGAAAENRAVVISNSNYAELPDVPQVDATTASARFKQRGFRVVEGADLTAADIRTALSDLLRADDNPGQRVVVLKGRFVHSRNETWFLGQDAEPKDAVSVGLMGVPLSLVVELIEGGNPNSILLLGTDSDKFDAGTGLTAGWGMVPAPSGVTVLAGYTDGIGRAADILARQDGTVEEALKQGKSLRLLSGVTPGGTQPVVVPPVGSQPVVVPPAGLQPVVVPPPSQPAVVPPSSQPVVVDPPRRLDDVVPPDSAEQAAWTQAKRTNSIAGYREFLGKYPNSIFAGAARGRMDELTEAAAPKQSGPAVIETELGLSRDRKAQIQRQLTLLNYDTKGIDGSFGPATRSAISRFQRDKGAQVTGYLNQPQINLLAKLSAERSKQLEADAQKRQRASDAADTQYWNEQRRLGAAGAQRYLSRYPRGLHEDAARNILADAARSSGNEGVEAAWRRTVAANRPDAYRAFLNNHPRSPYTAEARRRIAEAEETASKDQAYEAALDLTPQVRSIVEQRLVAQGFKVGKVDGRFDAQTRQAIRRYQASRNLRASGYLNQNTVVRLLGDSLVARD